MSRELLELKYVIVAWENSLTYDRFLMSPSTAAIVSATICHLKRLDTMDKKVKNTKKIV